MNEIKKIQNWYLSQCDGDWEHDLGVKIETIDNPGWKVWIDLEGTELEKKEMTEFGYGIGDEAEESGEEWIHCKKEENQFHGYGGPLKLEEILRFFIDWIEDSRAEQIGSHNSGGCAPSA